MVLFFKKKRGGLKRLTKGACITLTYYGKELFFFFFFFLEFTK
jgi:hypothetical protein